MGYFRESFKWEKDNLSTVKIDKYKVIQREGTTLVGVGYKGAGGKYRIVLEPNFVDVAYARCFGRVYLAAKPIGSNTFTVFCKSKDYSIDGVYDLLFMDKSIWVKIIKDDKFFWARLGERLIPTDYIPFFEMPEEVRNVSRFVCSFRNRVIKVKLVEDDGYDYSINLETAECNALSRRLASEKTVKAEVTGYKIKVTVGDNGCRLVAVDNLDSEKVLCTVKSFSILKDLVNKLLNSQPELKDYGYLYKNLDFELVQRFIKVFSTIKSGDTGEHIAYVIFYLRKTFDLKLGTVEFLDKLIEELRNGYKELASYNVGDITYKIGYKAYKLDGSLVCFYRTYSNDYLSRISTVVLEESEDIDLSLLDNYCSLNVETVEILSSIDGMDVSSDKYPELEDICLKSLRTIASGRYDKKSNIKLVLSKDNIRKELLLDVYCRFVYKPTEKKSGNKVYEVGTYCSVIDVLKLENI